MAQSRVRSTPVVADDPEAGRGAFRHHARRHRPGWLPRRPARGRPAAPARSAAGPSILMSHRAQRWSGLGDCGRGPGIHVARDRAGCGGSSRPPPAARPPRERRGRAEPPRGSSACRAGPRAPGCAGPPRAAHGPARRRLIGIAMRTSRRRALQPVEVQAGVDEPAAIEVHDLVDRRPRTGSRGPPRSPRPRAAGGSCR